jgi:hypothetical protein
MTRTPQHQASPATRAGVRHTVRVGALSRRRRQAVCTCGWQGRRRLLRCVAVFDALSLAGASGCKLSLPLVSPARALLAYTEACRHD